MADRAVFIPLWLSPSSYREARNERKVDTGAAVGSCVLLAQKVYHLFMYPAYCLTVPSLHEASMSLFGVPAIP
jgi:hypothetical protein